MAGRKKSRSENNFHLTSEIIKLIYTRSKKTAPELEKLLEFGSGDGKSFSVYKCGSQALGVVKLKEVILKSVSCGWINSEDLEILNIRLENLGISGLLSDVLTEENKRRQLSASCPTMLIEVEANLDDLQQIYCEERAQIVSRLEEATRDAAMLGLTLLDVHNAVISSYTSAHLAA